MIDTNTKVCVACKDGYYLDLDPSSVTLNTCIDINLIGQALRGGFCSCLRRPPTPTVPQRPVFRTSEQVPGPGPWAEDRGSLEARANSVDLPHKPCMQIWALEYIAKTTTSVGHPLAF